MRRAEQALARRVQRLPCAGGGVVPSLRVALRANLFDMFTAFSCQYAFYCQPVSCSPPVRANEFTIRQRQIANAKQSKTVEHFRLYYVFGLQIIKELLSARSHEFLYM